jgi:DNA-binding XRE family transcriptional regulator
MAGLDPAIHVFCLREPASSVARMEPSVIRDYTQAKQSPDPIDEYIGNRVRMRREMLAMSQQKLGAALGVTRQYMQKCETGTRRLTRAALASSKRCAGAPSPKPWFLGWLAPGIPA